MWTEVFHELKDLGIKCRPRTTRAHAQPSRVVTLTGETISREGNLAVGRLPRESLWPR